MLCGEGVPTAPTPLCWVLSVGPSSKLGESTPTTSLRLRGAADLPLAPGKRGLNEEEAAEASLGTLLLAGLILPPVLSAPGLVDPRKTAESRVGGLNEPVVGSLSDDSEDLDATRESTPAAALSDPLAPLSDRGDGGTPNCSLPGSSPRCDPIDEVEGEENNPREPARMAVCLKDDPTLTIPDLRNLSTSNPPFCFDPGECFAPAAAGPFDAPNADPASDSLEEVSCSESKSV